MKKSLMIGLVAAMVIVALAAGNAKPPKLPGGIDPKALGIDPKQAEQIQQGINAATGMAQANKEWTFKEERATGRVLAARVAASFGGISKSAAWNDYVNKIGRGLVPFSSRPDIKYRFAILNTDDVNAYACPGGYVFVTRGLLRRVKSEAALAGVLAHEIAHISQKHIEKEVRKQKVAGVALDSGLTFAAGEGKLSGDEVNVIKKLGDAGYEILVKKGYAREDETEADRLAVRTMARMGYSPDEYRTLIESLGGKGDNKLAILVSTHPAAADRGKAIAEQIKNKKFEGLAVLSERLEAVRKSNPL